MPSDTNDPLAEPLRACAEEAFPEIFESDWADTGRWRTSSDCSAAFYEVARNDRHLQRALPDDSFVSSSSGLGTRFDTRMLEGGILSAAALRAVMSGGDLSVARLIEEAERCLADVRRLVNGETVMVPVMTAFSMTAFDLREPVPTPWGLLRRTSDFEAGLRPFVDLQREYVDRPRAVLVGSAPVKWRVGEPGDDLTERPGIEMWSYLDAHFRKLALASLLACSDSDLRPPAHLWRVDGTPLRGAWNFSPLRLFPQTSPFYESYYGREIQPVSDDELYEWCTRVEANFHLSLEDAVDRLLGACMTRENTEHILIDAVIVWETLFGHGAASEVSFRITTALALLLGGDAKQKADLRQIIRTIYDLRSRILHGARITSADRLWYWCDQAVQIALAAFRTLLTDRSDLIASTTRGLDIIMGL